jgi:hypothetical protein
MDYKIKHVGWLLPSVQKCKLVNVSMFIHNGSDACKALALPHSCHEGQQQMTQVGLLPTCPATNLFCIMMQQLAYHATNSLQPGQ